MDLDVISLPLQSGGIRCSQVWFASRMLAMRDRSRLYAI